MIHRNIQENEDRELRGVAVWCGLADLKSWVPKGACGFDARPRHLLLNVFVSNEKPSVPQLLAG